MDLSLLAHLSDEALRVEAKRRGIATTAKSREAIIALIREHERPRTTKPEPNMPAPRESEPKRSKGRRGVFGVARQLFGRVIKRVLEPERPPPPAAGSPVAREPIPTRTMAELLIDQGQLERAIAILASLGDDGARTRLAEIESRLAKSRLEKAAAAHRRDGVAILSERGVRAVVWRVDEAGLARARALLRAEGQLTLRIVTVEADAALAVSNRSEDRGPIEQSGFELLETGPGARLVVSVGLREADRFVSVAHTAS